MGMKLSERRSLERRIKGITMPITRKRIKWSRNWPCLCGSKKKYKNCCLNEIEGLTISDGNAKVQKLSEDVEKMIADEQEAKKKF